MFFSKYKNELVKPAVQPQLTFRIHFDEIFSGKILSSPFFKNSIGGFSVVLNRLHSSLTFSEHFVRHRPSIILKLQSATCPPLYPSGNFSRNSSFCRNNLQPLFPLWWNPLVIKVFSKIYLPIFGSYTKVHFWVATWQVAVMAFFLSSQY